MSYSSFLIANYSTGYDRELQPWLLPDDAFVELLDGFVYRGVTQKRDGYSGFATGNAGIYTESRMVHELKNVALTGTINGTNKIFTATLTTPVSRGSITITGNDPSQTVTDDGLGNLVGDVDGTGTNEIDYTTGALTVTFLVAPVVASTVTITYSYYPGNPVMGIMSFYPDNNVREMIVADTQYVNKYDPSTNRLVDISPASVYGGQNNDFWSWVNYADASSNPRLLFCNRVNGNVIQQWDGSTVTDYAPTFTTGDPPVSISLNARQMFVVKDRLVLFQTIEAGVLYPRRIRISGTGQNCDVFNNTAPGAGFIDIPDNTWFFGAAFNRDDVMFFTEAATWVLKYTGNDVNPFSLEKIDGSRGSSAAFSVISYLNRTLAASPRGLIITDGYQVDRYDNSIPDFTFNNIQDNSFDRCYSAFLDEDRDVYMLYPSDGDVRPPLVATDSSDRILVMNFEEDNFAIYRIPLSCAGNFQIAETKLWQDLTAANGYENWDILAVQYGDWNAFPFSKGTPITIGGGHKGEIWRLNNTESDDNPQKIRNIVVLNADTLRVTTDWNNYEVGDFISFDAIVGTVEANDRQGEIISTTPSPYNTFDVRMQHKGFSPYISGGEAARVIPFSATSKKLNPWVNQDKKVKCGWIYFYVSVAVTDLKEDGVNVPAILGINVITSNREIPTKTAYDYEIDCTLGPNQTGDKKWVKIWINQVGQFLQFTMHNNQSGAKIKVHAMVPGLQPTGRLV